MYTEPCTWNGITPCNSTGWSPWSRQQLCVKAPGGAGGAGGQEAEREWAVQPVRRQPAAYRAVLVSTKRVEGSDRSPLFSMCEINSVVLGPAAGSPVRDGPDWSESNRGAPGQSGGRSTWHLGRSWRHWICSVLERRLRRDLAAVPNCLVGGYGEDRAGVHCRRTRRNRSWNMRNYDLIRAK